MERVKLVVTRDVADTKLKRNYDGSTIGVATPFSILPQHLYIYRRQIFHFMCI